MQSELPIAMDEARALVSDRVLWPRVRDFLWDFAPQVHESWLEGVFASVDRDRLQAIAIDSRVTAVHFYGKLGYEQVDDEVIRSGTFDCIKMRKTLR